jgi:hypothetical protein
MQQSPVVTVTLILTDDQAWALAQFLKRVGLDDWRRLAESELDAYVMRSAGEAVRAELARVGYAPR